MDSDIWCSVKDFDDPQYHMYAIADDAVADDEGVYSCVMITFEDDDGERGSPIGVEESP